MQNGALLEGTLFYILNNLKTNKIMKVIYMEHTLNLMAAGGLEILAAVKEIVASGTIKQTEVGTYLVIETKPEEQI